MLVICPNCCAGEISPLTGRCELCGFTPEDPVVVRASRDEGVDPLAHEELASLFRLDVLLGHDADSGVYVAREQDSGRHIVVKVMVRPTEQQVSGRSLRNFLAARPPLDLKGCQRIVAQVASALDYAHRRGVVHGALKAENVLVDAVTIGTAAAETGYSTRMPPVPLNPEPWALNPEPRPLAPRPWPLLS